MKKSIKEIIMNLIVIYEKIKSADDSEKIKLHSEIHDLMEKAKEELY